MASTTSNTADIQQSFMNNITQQDQQNCLATTDNTANNNVVIVNGVNIGGDFTGVSLTTSTDASCLMVSNMEDSVSNILSASLSQTNKSETDMFNGFQITDDSNSFNITQSVTNNITQINQATCSANTTVSASNNYVYVTNTSVGGNFVGVTSDASSSANCSMTNIMKNTTYNQAQASASQSNTVEGMFAALVAAFVAVIGLIVFAVIIMFATGSIGYIGYSKSKTQTPESGQASTSSDDALLSEAEQLGLGSGGLNSLGLNLGSISGSNPLGFVSTQSPGARSVSATKLPGAESVQVSTTKSPAISKAE